MVEVYVLDTNVFLDIFERYYPSDVFPGIRVMFERLAEEQRMIVPRDVREEIGDKEGKGKVYANWLDGLGVVRELDDRTSDVMLHLMAGIGKQMVDFRRSKNGADPVVLAFAISMRGTVVTSEQSAPRSKFVKIPDACSQCNVNCLTVLEFFRAASLEL